MNGKVYIIGAGPGDPELLTLKAKKYIQKADIIIYDRLVSDSILMFSKPDVEYIYVGKKPGFHIVVQSEINKILVTKALEGKIVARIKGGDPFVFGRGGEEIEELLKCNIDYEVIPGITSAIAVPAYAGIPVTHRNYASSFHIITGHEKNKNNDMYEYKKLANLDGTLVFVMGISNMNSIVNELILGGKPQNTPVAIIQNGTTNRQKQIYGNLENICILAKENNIISPAVMVIGKVAELGKTLSWIKTKTLTGKNILVTRSRTQSSVLAEKLIEQGAEVFQCPTIKIVPVEKYNIVDTEISNIEKYKWIIFTSVNGVKHFFERMKHTKTDIRKIKGDIAVIGEETKKAVEDKGLIVKYIPDKYTSYDLGQGLKTFIKYNDNILLARADIADKNIINILENVGGKCTDLIVYKIMIDNRYQLKLTELLQESKLDYITFASSSTVDNFMKIVGENNRNFLKNIKIICIGPVTAKKAKEHGLEDIIISDVYTIDGMVDTIKSLQ